MPAFRAHDLEESLETIFAYIYIFCLMATSACSLYLLYLIYQEEPGDALLSFICSPFYFYAIFKHRHSTGPVFLIQIALFLVACGSLALGETYKQKNVEAQLEEVREQTMYEQEIAEIERKAKASSPYERYTSDPKGYEAQCAGCHDSGLAGAPKPKDTERWKAILSERTIEEVMLNAYKGRGGHPRRGGGEHCSPDNIDNMTFYMLVESGADLE